jgi:hypothetical protein
MKVEFTGASLAFLAVGGLSYLVLRDRQREEREAEEAQGSAGRQLPFDPSRPPGPRLGRKPGRRALPPMRAWQMGPMRPAEAQQIAAHIRQQAELDPSMWHHEVRTPSRDGKALVLFVARRPYPGAKEMRRSQREGSRAPMAAGAEDIVSDQRLRQQAKVRQAPAASQLSFTDWVEQVEGLRGRPLVEGDPWEPVTDAAQAITWYDLWFTGTSPEQAAQR